MGTILELCRLWDTAPCVGASRGFEKERTLALKAAAALIHQLNILRAPVIGHR
jgi:hypothetical protein